jgi:hypothetical protein
MLEIESLNQIHNQIGWIITSLFNEQHLYQLLGREEKDHLTIFTENRIPLDVGRPIREAPRAHQCESSHGWCKVVSGLIYFFLPQSPEHRNS